MLILSIKVKTVILVHKLQLFNRGVAHYRTLVERRCVLPQHLDFVLGGKIVLNARMKVREVVCGHDADLVALV